MAKKYIGLEDASEFLGVQPDDFVVATIPLALFQGQPGRDDHARGRFR